MSKFAVEVENLSKSYLIGRKSLRTERYAALRDVVAHNFRSVVRRTADVIQGRGIVQGDELEQFWALEDISFSIEPGERLGVLGRNGAGKSTLLKVLSRITEPTKGRVRMAGRVTSLLEVGTGFHPELTGRENIFLNGAILGMSKKEIRRKFDSIVEFAEVEKFLDTPVKRYSSGMYVRLAFSVAAHLDSDILIVDEVLAVGDAGFQKKCMGKMESIANEEGRTILFVSHNMGAISELCTKAALMHQGRLIASGDVPYIIDRYARLALPERDTSISIKETDDHLPSSIMSVRVSNSKGSVSTSFDIADEVVIEIVYKVRHEVLGHQLTVTLARNMVDILHSFDTDGDAELPIRSIGTYLAVYRVPGMCLKAGSYGISVYAGTPDLLIQSLEQVASFDVEEWSINAQSKGYRRERPGHMISPGVWETKKLSFIPPINE